jgi:transcriptional regulator with XRE-family HTH domain
MRSRGKTGATDMPLDSAALLVQCQFALGLTQKELGDLLGRDRRTIQRWQEKGFVPLPDLARTLAQALKPVRPDLAEQVIELGGRVTMGLPRSPATAETVDGILRAAADAVGTSPEAIRPAITAALLKAEEIGVDVSAIVAGLAAVEQPR